MVATYNLRQFVNLGCTSQVKNSSNKPHSPHTNGQTNVTSRLRHLPRAWEHQNIAIAGLLLHGHAQIDNPIGNPPQIPKAKTGFC